MIREVVMGPVSHRRRRLAARRPTPAFHHLIESSDGSTLLIVATTLDRFDTTPLRLLDAAERLIGERGVDAVSVRAINAAAGSNVAAAHYHFGSKAALVRAVLDRRMTTLAQDRRARLTAIEHEASPAPAAVAAVIVLPLYEFGETSEGAAYVRFLAALGRSGGEWLEVMDGAFAPQWELLGPVLERAVPWLDDARRALRLRVASETMLQMLADAPRYSGDLDAESYRDEVVAVFTAILTGPPEIQETR
jgi:AcrR family transcriptional regulator